MIRAEQLIELVCAGKTDREIRRYFRLDKIRVFPLLGHRSRLHMILRLLRGMFA